MDARIDYETEIILSLFYSTNFDIFLFQLDIISPRGRKLLHSCFDPTYGGKESRGWCATCDPDAKRGQRGYCGQDQTNSNEEGRQAQ